MTTGTDVPNGAPTMVDEYDGGLTVDVAGGGVVDKLVVEGVLTVIWACAGVPESNTQPITGHQISCEQRELIVMGACGHPGTGPMVG